MMYILNKRAVSPVVAAILLIGLVVTAGAMLALVILPMINNNVLDADNILINVNGQSLTISNKHVFEITLEEITVNGNNYTINTVIKPGQAGLFNLLIEPVEPLKLFFSGKNQFVTIEVVI